jgi:hypothetical protein
MKRELLIGIKLLLLLFSQVANAQVSVELSTSDANKISPELYFMSKLEESIFTKHEGMKLTNLASVKFDVDKEGHVSNIAFSISTDSLLEPYIVDVLMSTDRKWVIRRDGKLIKSKVSIILPILFRLRPHTVKKVSTRINEISGKPSENMTWEQIHVFQFDKKNDNLLLFYRDPIKYEGITLNPIEVRVPNDPDADDY